MLFFFSSPEKQKNREALLEFLFKPQYKCSAGTSISKFQNQNNVPFILLPPLFQIISQTPGQCQPN